MIRANSVCILPCLALYYSGRTGTYVAEFLHDTRHIAYLAAEAWRQSFQLSSDVEISLWNTGQHLWLPSSHSLNAIHDATLLQENFTKIHVKESTTAKFMELCKTVHFLLSVEWHRQIIPWSKLSSSILPSSPRNDSCHGPILFSSVPCGNSDAFNLTSELQDGWWSWCQARRSTLKKKQTRIITPSTSYQQIFSLCPLRRHFLFFQGATNLFDHQARVLETAP